MSNKRAPIVEIANERGAQLRSFLRARVRNVADVPDIIQEVFLRLLRVPREETIRTPEAYIFTVAHHVALQHAMQSGLSNAAVELDELLTDSLPLNHPDPALEVSAAQFLEQLDAALCQLSPKIQAAFLMYRRDGASLDEISERLHITRPMTKKYLAKAMMHLRNRLKEIE